MTLKTQLVDINFDQGIDTRDDGFLITGSFEKMTNVERQKAGGVIKRNGFEKIKDSTSIKINEVDGNLVEITSLYYLEKQGIPLQGIKIPLFVTYSDSKYVVVYKVVSNGDETLMIGTLSSDFKTYSSVGAISHSNPDYVTNKNGNVLFAELSNGMFAVIFEATNLGNESVIICVYNGTTLNSCDVVYETNRVKLRAVCSTTNTVYVTMSRISSGDIKIRTDKLTVSTGSISHDANCEYTKGAGTSLDGEYMSKSCADGSNFCFIDNVLGFENTVTTYTSGDYQGFSVSNASATGNTDVYVGGVLMGSSPVATPIIIAGDSSGNLKIGSVIYPAYSPATNLPIECRTNKCITLMNYRGTYITQYTNVPISNETTFFSASANLTSTYLKNTGLSYTLPSHAFMNGEMMAFFDYESSTLDIIGTRALTYNTSTHAIGDNDVLAWGQVACGSGPHITFFDQSSYSHVDVKNITLDDFYLTLNPIAILNQGIASALPSTTSKERRESYRSKYDLYVLKTQKNGDTKFTISQVSSATSNTIQTLQLTNKVYATGAILNKFNSAGDYAELNFIQRPTTVSENLDQSGGYISAGTYNYAFTFSYVDSNGDLEESSPFFRSNVVTTGSNKANFFTISSPTFTRKFQSDIYFNVYRTKNNESIFYKIFNGPCRFPTTSYVDTFADSWIDSKWYNPFATDDGTPIIYTTGGILPNTAIGACSSITATKNRIFVSSIEDRTKVFFSKEKLSGYDFEMNGLQYIDANGGQFEGDITALCALDERIIIGKDRYLLYIAGDGPNAAGGGSDFSIPQLVSTDVGISDKSSVVVTPNGLMFKTLKGIYLLSRGLQVSYIGILADSYKNETVYSTLMSPYKNHVYFGMSGKVLVYDYLLNNWFVWSGLNDVIDAYSMCFYNNQLCILTSAGKILTQNSGYADMTGNIITEIETSWLEAGSVNGFQRLRRIMFLGHAHGNASYDVKISRDYDTTVLETHTLAITDSSGKVHRNLHVANQKSTTTKINIKESGTGTTNKTSLSGITFELGLKRGTAKVSSSSKF